MLKTFLLAACLLMVCPVSLAASVSLAISGSTTILPALKQIVNLPQVAELGHIDLRGGGSLVGLQDLAAGKIDIAMIAMDMPAAYAERFTSHVIGYDAVVLIVNENNTITHIGEQQVRDVYEGRLRNWQTLGGVDAGITPIAKKAMHSTRHLFDQFYSINSGEQGVRLVGSNAEMIVMVATDVHALGYVSIGSLQQARRNRVLVRGLAMGDGLPLPRMIAEGKVPMTRPLSLVVRKNSTDANIRKFIAHALSKEGQALMATAGYLPREN